MVPDEDIRRLHEGHHDVQAALDGAKLTDEVALQSALALSRDEVAARYQALVGAVQGAAREDEETRRARLKLEAAGALAQAQWRYVGQEVSRGLLNPPPENKPSQAEMTAREGLVGRLFALAPYEFGRQTIGRQVELLRSTIQLAQEAVVRDTLGAQLADLIVQRLSAAQATITEQQDELDRELREDREAHAAVVVARDAFDLSLLVHTMLVRAVLLRAGREGELGKYVRAHDAAYRARRLSGRPMKEETGIEVVTTALGVSPEALDVPPPA